MKPEVKWKAGYRGVVPAPDAYEVFQKVQKKTGDEVTAQALVAEAQNPKCKIHNAFEWDDTIAGHEYRCTQARTMLRSICVIRLPEEKTTSTPRSIETVRLPATPAEPARVVYRDLESVMADPQARAELLNRALAELLSFQRRYRHLQELAVVFRAIEEVAV